MSLEPRVIVPEVLHLDLVRIPCADELLVLVRVVVEHERGNLEGDRVLHELVYTVSHVRRRLPGHHRADLQLGLSFAIAEGGGER